MVASGRGAQLGVLFRNAEAIESLREIDTLGLDKTGTLTVGRPAFDRVLTVGAWKENELLALAAGLGRSSGHPRARAIVEGAASSGNTPAAVSDFQSVTGRGVTGTHNGRKLALGNLALMNDVGASVDPVRTEVERLRKSGRTVMFLTI